MFDTPVTLQDILASYKTLGCCVGAATVIAVWIIITVIGLWREFRYNRQLIVMSTGEGGTFQIAYATVRQHTLLLLKRRFPQLTLKKVRIGHWGRYSMKIVALASDRADLKILRDSVQQSVMDLVDHTLGLEGMFSRIDITISGLRPSQGEPDLAEAASAQNSVLAPSAETTAVAADDVAPLREP